MFRITRSTLATALALAALALAGTGRPAEAQFGRRLKDAIKHNAENGRSRRRPRPRTRRSTARPRDGVEGAAGARTSAGRRERGRAGRTLAATAAPTVATAITTAEQLKPGEGAWANYDFKPGDRILYASDFSGDEVGDFPRQHGVQVGGAGDRRVAGTRGGSGPTPGLEVLPGAAGDPAGASSPWSSTISIPSDGEVWIYFAPDENNGCSQFGGHGHGGGATTRQTVCGWTAGWRAGQARRRHGPSGPRAGDGKYMKVYLDDTRLLNVPNADLGREHQDRCSTPTATADDADPLRQLPGRGGRQEALRRDRVAKGRVATQGIYFDTGSDRIRPESTPNAQGDRRDAQRPCRFEANDRGSHRRRRPRRQRTRLE